ncbi:MAG: hypothetical protein IPJ47_07315 [Anaerolineales bacterium]|nr:hypothetical protein [Anaerolineales bacterium]
MNSSKISAIIMSASLAQIIILIFLGMVYLPVVFLPFNVAKMGKEPPLGWWFCTPYSPWS